MPRLPIVTMNELEDMADAAAIDGSRMQEMADRILKGYCEKPDKLVAKINALNSAIGGASALMAALIQKLYLEELKVETERTLRDRAGMEG